MEQNINLWQASQTEICQGYVYHGESEQFVCLVCGHRTESGVVYPDGDRYLDAEKAMKRHIINDHGGMMTILLGLGKSHTGLSENQIEVMRRLHQGMSDREVAKDLMLTESTIRNYRFKFREREKQAKVFMAIMRLLGEEGTAAVPVHLGATMVDDRYDIREDERDRILSRYFDPQGRLIDFPAKQKRKIIILSSIAGHFKTGREYSEKEVNRLLERIYDDYVTLRRYLIEYGYLDRSRDGRSYWVK